MNEAILFAALLVVLGMAALLAKRPREAAAPEPRDRFDSASEPATDRGPGPAHRQTTEILEQMDDGILVLNESLTLTFANRRARTLLDIRSAALPPIVPVDGILSVARRALAEDITVQDIVTLWPQQAKLKVHAAPLSAQQAVVVVMRDVTEEIRTQQIRRQFVASASHELKSPVAGMAALAEALRQAIPGDPDEAVRFADRIAHESARLARLINDLLDLSRLEDPVNVSSASIDLSEVARSELEAIDSPARDKNVRLESSIEPRVHVRGDGQQLALMIKNLLDNAVRYTPEGGTVRLEVARGNGIATVTVQDDGIGIPMQSQARIFERFYRVDKDRARESGGTGLGLSIVKHVAELHGGHIAVKSELGEGSVFTARLPLTEPSNGVEASPIAI